MGSINLRNNPAFTDRLHYTLDVGGTTIAYCYIRKNASTAFKLMFLRESPHEKLPDEDSGAFLVRCHKAWTGQVKAAAHRVVILRDPYERMSSLYLNKFVQMRNHEPMMDSYWKATGRDPAVASFTDFVRHYLTEPLPGLDPHVRTQASHLSPVTYNAAFRIEDLSSGLASILGPDLAGKYFAEKANAFPTAGAAARISPSMPASELRAALAAGQRIDHRDLYSRRLASRLRTIYRDDYELLGMMKD